MCRRDNDEMGWTCCMHLGIRNAYNILVQKPLGRTPFGRPTRRWMNIKIELKEMWCKDVDWIKLAKDRVQTADSCEHGDEYSSSIKVGFFSTE
jgi:hypothetical protein